MTVVRTYAFLLAGSLLVVPAAGAQQIHVSFNAGRVTLHANDASIAGILAEWARVGLTRVVNLEQVEDVAHSFDLTDVPEDEAVDALLRSAGGYVAVRRASGGPDNISQIDRIVIIKAMRTDGPEEAQADVTRAGSSIEQSASDTLQSQAVADRTESAQASQSGSRDRVVIPPTGPLNEAELDGFIRDAIQHPEPGVPAAPATTSTAIARGAQDPSASTQPRSAVQKTFSVSDAVPPTGGQMPNGAQPPAAASGPQTLIMAGAGSSGNAVQAISTPAAAASAQTGSKGAATPATAVGAARPGTVVPSSAAEPSRRSITTYEPAQNSQEPR
jgi:hypothetical protein